MCLSMGNPKKDNALQGLTYSLTTPRTKDVTFGYAQWLLPYHFALMFHSCTIVHCCLCACVYLWVPPTKTTHCKG